MAGTIQPLWIDGHVHIYPAYDWRTAVRSLAGNIARFSGGNGPGIGFLAEGAGCRFFRDVREKPDLFRDGSLAIEPCGDPGALVVRQDGQALAYLVAGRQIITAERLEVLAVGADTGWADGEPAGKVLEQVLSAGAIPVLSWSPGKWFAGRGRVVRSLIESHAPGQFLLGDTALRPKGWGFPVLLTLGKRRGFKVIGGSDPLPLAGEEARLGSYGVQVRADFDPGKPAESVCRMLRYANVFYVPFGERLCPLDFAGKWVANWKRKPGRGRGRVS